MFSVVSVCLFGRAKLRFGSPRRPLHHYSQSRRPHSSRPFHDFDRYNSPIPGEQKSVHWLSMGSRRQEQPEEGGRSGRWFLWERLVTKEPAALWIAFLLCIGIHHTGVTHPPLPCSWNLTALRSPVPRDLTVQGPPTRHVQTCSLWSTYSWQADGWHSTGLLASWRCFFFRCFQTVCIADVKHFKSFYLFKEKV